jgi:glycosyltransferase involved in cell wall biosynthesis
MLSILIPVYNYDVRAFVTELHRQSTAAGINFEIRCYDDGSSGNYKEINRELEQMRGVEYREIPSNLGRSAIRNLLARDAAFEYLLFLDCDSYPENDDFIARYAAALTPGAIVYGGRTYDPMMPQDKRRMLRWKYGSAREVFPVAVRKLKPYHSFQTNNFVVPRSVFRAIGLNEGLKGYGHEDTQFGQQLMARQVPILHIDNPLRHLGLETTEEFLLKTDEGVKNLYHLITHGYNVSTIKLARAYRFIRKLGITRMVGWLLRLRGKALLKNLHSGNPGLMAFDLYKLMKLIEASQSVAAPSGKAALKDPEKHQIK